MPRECGATSNHSTVGESPRTGSPAFAGDDSAELSLRHTRHAPAIDGSALERAEYKTLGGEADEADRDDRGEHRVGIQKLLGVENDPAQTPVGCGQHFGAYHRDP